MSTIIGNNNTIIKYANDNKLCLLYATLIAKQCWDKSSNERWASDNPKNLNNNFTAVII
jgi:hypothetical protein